MQLPIPFFMSVRLPAPLLGERVKLRLLEERDAAALLALYGDPEVMRYWNHAPWRTLGEARAAIAEAHQEYAAGRSLHLAIEHRERQTLIGSCALYGMAPRGRSAMLGYLLSRPHWGQGYLKEALRALLEHAMGDLRLNRLEAEVHPGNAASIRALEGFGFKVEEQRRQRWIVAGAACDIVLYALLRRNGRIGGA